MKLKSFGCSFIFGSELHDDGWDGIKATPSRYTWPALWAKDLGLEYQCFARPGAGNMRIAEQVLNQIHSEEPALYVIGWTWIERFDFVTRNADTWRTITAWDSDTIADHYYKYIHSQYQDKLQTLSNASLVVEQLQKHQCKFFMTFMDDLMWETEFHCSPAMQLLQAQLRPLMHNFDGQNFLEWSRVQGFPIGTRGIHPLEQAHQAAYQYVKLHHNFS